MTTRLLSILSELSALPRSEHPVLSVYLDWSVDSSGQRQALAALDQELDRLGAEIDQRGPARDSFEADRERIAAYLDTDAPRDASGLALFASHGQGLWQVIPLVVPVETSIGLDSVPRLYQLAWLLDEYEPFAVAVADGQEAQIFVVTLEAMAQVDRTEAREEIQRVDVGGWSQLRYQRHTGFVIQLHMNDLAAALQQVVDRYDVAHLVILTNDSVKGHIRAALPPQLHELLVDMLPYERSDDPEQLFANLDPVMRQVERQQEQELLERLETQLATKGGLAFGGDLSVVTALHKGQVDTLLLSADYAGGAGSECRICGSLWPGQLESCPYDGGELLPVDLREAVVLHTLRQGGRVEVVGIEGALNAHGGIAALLRFRDDVAESRGIA